MGAGGMNPNDIFQQFFEGWEVCRMNFSFNTSSSRSGNVAHKGPNKKIEIGITTAEMMNGTTKDLQ